ncbi:DUF6550 family protein [Oscillospiraceae bacterium LTW-04]|nr:hypothetical protein RBH76_10390 [Oscillospiraceae bacterium MB24-C1]
MKKTKIALTATTLAILSLMITAYHTELTSSPTSPQNCPVSEVVEASKIYTQPIETKPLAGEEMTKISTQIEKIVEPPTKESSTTQPTEKEISGIPPISDTRTATKPPTLTPKEPPTPQMGDTRIMNGQKQSYFLGFGWVDYMGENECIFAEDMYENGNKIGIMGGGTMVGSDGDINKMVGIMD